MAQLRALSLAIDQARRRRDAALEAMLRARQACQGAQDQMEQLRSYARDTETRWALGACRSTQPEIVLHYDHFMDRLQQAVDLQQGVVTELSRTLTDARQCLLQAEVRAAGLQRLLEQRRSEAQRCQAVRDQKQQDELAALLVRRRNASSTTTGTS